MNIEIRFVSRLLKEHPENNPGYRLFTYPHSFAYYDDAEQKFYICIDDDRTTRKRQRFSLAHEIMHIILGHSEQNEMNEAEANFGATYLLCPTSLVLSGPQESLLSPEKVATVFDVSEAESEIAVRYYSHRLSCTDSEIKSYEKLINELLGDSVLEKCIGNSK